MTNRLFKDGDLRTFFEQRRVRMLQEIERFDPNRLQSASTEELTKYFYERYLVDPVQLLRDAAELDDPPREVQIPAEHFPNMFRARPGMTVAGLRYVLRVPFEGHEGLFRYQPSTFTYSGTPTAEIEGQQVVLSSDHLSTESPETVRAGFVSVIDDIAKHLE